MFMDCKGLAPREQRSLHPDLAQLGVSFRRVLCFTGGMWCKMTARRLYIRQGADMGDQTDPKA